MTWEIADCVTHGEWDNRQRDRIFIRLWLAGRKEAVHVELTGNGQRDLAGCLLTFRRREQAAPARPGPGRGNFAPVQGGVAGRMSASHRIWDSSLRAGGGVAGVELGLDPADRLANSLVLEWYNESRERVLLESTDFELGISEHGWMLTAEEDQRLRVANGRRYAAYLLLSAEQSPEGTDDGDDTD